MQDNSSRRRFIAGAAAVAAALIGKIGSVLGRENDGPAASESEKGTFYFSQWVEFTKIPIRRQ